MAKKNEIGPEIDEKRLPCHIAIIMDGNGRWANRRRMPRSLGHRAGVEALKKVVEAVGDLGIPYLTVYAFSTENWKRPKEEINNLMHLLVEYLEAELNTLVKKNVKIRVLGDLSPFPPEVRQAVERSLKATENNQGLVLSIALNYGGRADILQAVKQVGLEVVQGKMSLDEITEANFGRFLYTKDLPDPDLLIRTAGEMRISNFLLWQLAYSELWFTDVFWPDFRKEHLMMAIAEYQKRERRFGDVKAANKGGG